MTYNDFFEKNIELEQNFLLNEKKKNLDAQSEINDVQRNIIKNNEINKLKKSLKQDSIKIDEDGYVLTGAPGISPFDIHR